MSEQKNVKNSGQKNNDENLMAALSYLPIVGIIFLIIDKRPFVRFHSMQSIGLYICYVIITIVLNILSMIPFLGLIFWIVSIIINILFLIAAIYSAVQAYHGKEFKIFFIGDLVSKWV